MTMELITLNYSIRVLFSDDHMDKVSVGDFSTHGWSLEVMTGTPGSAPGLLRLP